MQRILFRLTSGDIFLTETTLFQEESIAFGHCGSYLHLLLAFLRGERLLLLGVMWYL